MTTPNTDLTEQIARVIYGEDPRWGYTQAGDEHGVDWETLPETIQQDILEMAAAALPIVEKHARAAAKAAWDECAQEQGAWPRPEGNPRALTYVLLANNPYMPKEEASDEQ